MKHEGKEWQQHHPCHGFAVQVSIFRENQSCHIHQHFEQMLDLTSIGYISASFAQHGRAFVFKKEYTWLSLQTLVTSYISLNNTRTKHKPYNHTTNLLCWRNPKQRASSRLCFPFTLLMPLQKRSSPVGQKKLSIKREPRQRTPKATILLPASLKCLLSHSSLPFHSPQCCCGSWTHQARAWNCSKNAARGSLSLRAGSTIPCLSLTHPSTSGKQTN